MIPTRLDLAGRPVIVGAGLAGLMCALQLAPEPVVVLARELGAAGIARLRVPGDGARFVWRQDPGGHHMGATRMGRDPAVSVVDGDCRAHDVRNLYITGASVFTTGGDSNPTLTVVALAHRLADTLNRLRKDAAGSEK